MKRTKRLLSVAAVAAVATVALTACGSSGSTAKSETSTPAASSTGSTFAGTVTVGSANFPENVLLANIYAEALKAKGIKVKTQLNIGSREVYYKLLESGSITVLPEYNGALLAYVDKSSTAKTKDDVDSALATKLPSGLQLLNPSAAEDKDSLNVTKANADKYGLASIADLSKVASQFTIGGPPEFNSRYIGTLQTLYGLTFKGFKPLDEAGSLTINALKGDEVQVADLFSTDSSIVTNNFVTLADPKTLFGAQNVTPLVYKAGIDSGVADVLNAVSAKLDTPTLVKLVSQVVNDKKDSDQVASDYLKSVGLS